MALSKVLFLQGGDSLHIKIKHSRNNRVFAGVLGGIAENHDWNANVLRVIWVVLTLMPFSGLISLSNFVVTNGTGLAKLNNM